MTMSEDTVPVSLDWHIVSLSSVEFILVAVYSSPGSTSPTCETVCYSEHAVQSPALKYNHKTL